MQAERQPEAKEMQLNNDVLRVAINSAMSALLGVGILGLLALIPFARNLSQVAAELAILFFLSAIVFVILFQIAFRKGSKY